MARQAARRLIPDESDCASAAGLSRGSFEMTTGGDEGIRTPDLCLPKATLLQPRYTPSVRNPAEGLQVNLLETPASVAVSTTVETELPQSDAGANPPDRVRQKKPMIASPSYPRCARLPPGPKPRRPPFPSFRLLVLHPGETGNPHSPRRRRAIYGIADQSQTTEAMLGERRRDDIAGEHPGGSECRTFSKALGDTA